MNGVPPGAGRGLRFHLEVGDLDAIDGLVDLPGQIGGLQQHLDDLLVPPFAARIGLHETPLTRAMSRGEFELAEALVLEAAAADPEYLNDGAHSATPLTLALTGRSSYLGQPRNLRLARLIAERGANVNLRIPNHDLETASESPLELLAIFYMSLLKNFQVSDRGRENNPGRRSHREYVETDLLDTIGLNKEEKMTPQLLISQTRELLHIFLDNGADVNLQTTDSGRTIFHAFLAAEVLDQELIDRMVTLGALVNLTDVHGTTPIMDVIRCNRCKDERDRAADTYRSLSQMGKRLLLDAQNCSGESALFRAMFYGKNSMTSLLLNEGAASFTMARVQENQLRRPTGRLMNYLHRRPSISNLPSLLAPLLGDSPCTKIASKRLLPAVTYPSKKFNVRVFNEVVAAKISPFVDLGWFCTREVEKTVHELVKTHTQFRHLTEGKVFQEIAIIPMLFGNLSGGLRQKCIRIIFSNVLFGNDSDAVLCMLKSLSTSAARTERRRVRGRHPRSTSEPKEWRDVDPGGCTCGVPSSVFSDSSEANGDRGFTLSEPEMSFSTSTPQASRISLAGDEDDEDTLADHGRPSSARQRRFGENWLLQEEPHYEQHRLSRSSDGIELQISVHEGSGDLVVELQDHHSTSSSTPSLGASEREVHKINLMLAETNDMLERLQTEVDTVQQLEVEALDKECEVIVEDLQRLSENLTEFNAEAPRHRQQVDEASTSEDNFLPLRHDPVIVQLQNEVASITPTLSTVSEEEEDEETGSSPLDYSSSKDDDSDEGSSGEAFSFGNVFYAARSNSQSLRSQSTPSSNHEAIIKLLTPEKVNALARHIGIPPGLKPCLDLEAARLQLGLAVFKHRSIECDRGCEGDDSGSSSDTDSSWGPDSLSGPSLTLSESDLESSLGDVDSVLSFEPSVPAHPRILSESSSDDEDEEAERSSRQRRGAEGSLRDSSTDDLGVDSSNSSSERDHKRGPPTKHEHEERQEPLAAAASITEDWFSFEGGDAEEETTRRYVTQNLADGFELSTDSDTSTDDASLAEEAGV